jgi:hypothetical protein
VAAGTTIWLMRRCAGASGSVTAITIANAAPSAPELNHLCPSITQSPPSRTAVVRRPVGSEPETSGSVIEKNERTSPATSGRSHRSRCSGVPNRLRISALPASGAWQPNTSGAQTLRPISSLRNTYGRNPRPVPPASGPMCGAHRPAAFTRARRSLTSASASSSSRSNTASLG